MKLSLSHISAGATAVFVGYSSAVVLILEAVKTLNGSPDVQSSWLLALGLAMGITSIVLSLRYKAPIFTAWSTPGIALLIVALQGVSLSQAVGIFIFSSTLIVLFGLSGISDRLIKYIPVSVAAAILAGILLKFVLAVMPAVYEQPIIAGSLVIAFFVLRYFTPRFVFFWVLLLAVGLPAFMQDLDFSQLSFSMPAWVWVWPEFDLSLMIGVGIPLFVVTMVSQNLPGIMMLRSNGYTPPMSPLLTTTGLAGLILAPLGAFAINLAAITAAICQSPEVDPDSSQRYKAAVAGGIFYLLAGLASSAIVGLFLMLPAAVTATIAGLALLPVLSTNMFKAFSDANNQLPPVLAFLTTASGTHFFGINSSFWGLLIGIVAFYLARHIKAKQAGK